MSARRIVLAGSLVAASGLTAVLALCGCGKIACDETSTCAAGPEAGPGTVDGGGVTDGAPPGPFCPQADASFCEDYDDASVGAPASAAKENGVIEVLREDDAPSAPHALQIRLDAVSAGGSAYANYTAFDCGAPHHVRLSFRMRVDLSGGGAALVGLARDKVDYQMFLDFDPGTRTLSLREKWPSTSTPHPFKRMLPASVGGWHQYELEISYGQENKYTLTVDGTSDTDTLVEGWQSDPLVLLPSAGVFNRGATGEQSVHYDNIVLFAD